jgi:HSP20 family protein
MTDNSSLQNRDETNDLGRPVDAEKGVTLTPRVDVLETADELLLVADLPGVDPKDVDVRFENGELTLHGRRDLSHNGKQPLYTEYEVANYYRAFRVSEQVAGDRIAAELKNGVLKVRLPKAEAAKPRRIAVQGV